MPQNSIYRIKITLSCGYDIHTLELTGSDYEKVKEGENLDIEG
jgi:hypothetical protein